MQNLRYNLLDAYSNGVFENPFDVMCKLGFDIKSEGVPVYDCIWVRIKNTVDKLPPYIDRLSDDFKFSDER